MDIKEVFKNDDVKAFESKGYLRKYAYFDIMSYCIKNKSLNILDYILNYINKDFHEDKTGWFYRTLIHVVLVEGRVDLFQHYIIISGGEMSSSDYNLVEDIYKMLTPYYKRRLVCVLNLVAHNKNAVGVRYVLNKIGGNIL